MFGTGPEKDFFEALAPYVSCSENSFETIKNLLRNCCQFHFQADLPFKMIFGNLWLFGPLVSFALGLQPMGNSMVRTTSAVTVVNGGLKDNMIPSSASALINHRIHPSQTLAEIIEYDKVLIADDRVKLTSKIANEPAQSSPHGDTIFGYQTIKQSIQQVFPDAIVVPGVMVAGTDTKWYAELTKNIYRFSPLLINKEEIILFHGHNERISIDNYVKAVNIYHHIVLSSDRAELPKPVYKTEL